VSTFEAAEAIEMLVKNGMQMPDIMNGAARSVVALSNATGGEFANSADIMTDAMALWKGEFRDAEGNLKNVEGAINGITSVTVKSKFTIDDYALALAQGGGVASAAGVSFDDFNTTIASISPYFASGSDAGTSFKTFLQRLIPASKEAERTMKDLGIMTADGANRFFDASGKMKPMAEVAEILQVAMSGLTEEQKNSALATLFGTDAMRAAVGLAETGGVAFMDLAGQMQEVDASMAAAGRMDTLAGQWEIFTGVIEGIGLSIGQSLMPAAQQFTGWITGLAGGGGSEVLKGIFESIGGGLNTAMEVLQQFSVEAGPIFSAWLTEMQTVMPEVGAVVKDAFGRIGEALKEIGIQFGIADEETSGMSTALTALQGVLDAVVIGAEAFALAMQGIAWAAEKTAEAIGIAMALMDQMNTITAGTANTEMVSAAGVSQMGTGLWDPFGVNSGGGGGGNSQINVNTTLNLDGQTVASNTSQHLGNRQQRLAAQGGHVGL
jgi:TP901 family phage tail tape measure protein